MLELERFCYSKLGTFGLLSEENNRFSCYTVERPWKSNVVRESCIPEGIYQLQKRASGIVSDTTDDKYTEGWEVIGVPSRSLIMIHIANVIDDIEGCIGPGIDLGCVYNTWGVVNSYDAFVSFMKMMDAYYPNGTNIRIYSAGAPEYP